MKQGEEIIASEEYQIENFEDGTSILVINDVYPDDAGVFTFEATNPLGVAVARTELVIEEGKDIILILKTLKNVNCLIIRSFFAEQSQSIFFCPIFPIFVVLHTFYTFNEIFLLLQILHLIKNRSKFSNSYEFL